MTSSFNVNAKIGEQPPVDAEAVNTSPETRQSAVQVGAEAMRASRSDLVPPPADFDRSNLFSASGVPVDVYHHLSHGEMVKVGGIEMPLKNAVAQNLVFTSTKFDQVTASTGALPERAAEVEAADGLRAKAEHEEQLAELEEVVASASEADLAKVLVDGADLTTELELHRIVLENIEDSFREAGLDADKAFAELEQMALGPNGATAMTDWLAKYGAGERGGLYTEAATYAESTIKDSCDALLADYGYSYDDDFNDFAIASGPEWAKAALDMFKGNILPMRVFVRKYASSR